MSTESLDDLFETGLKEMCYTEKQLLDALSDLESEVSDEKAQSAFREHRQETEGHVERLEEVFDKVGVSPEEKQLHAIDGLVEDHDEFVQNDPEQEALEAFDLTAAQKSEHLEIAAYGNLAHLADQLGHDEAGDLLHQNLEEEEEALDELVEATEQMDVSSTAD
ncbi:ferritin-like domain-containing protein [Halomicrococcus sp. NG-SE-24]|uniref:YciE/YciF ferroxidase family protein n=1 Tax=Halomicrococcus sp. NG-SE-24 TaxID=3436928 RepID=UPI003D96BB74